ncbi:MAG: hypothetical protein WC967_14720 [Balneolaceae bacterium]
MLTRMTLDYQMILLNAASVVALVKAFFTDNFKLDIDLDLTTIGGFLVLLSVVALNVAKTYKEIKSIKKDNEPK